MSDDAEASTGGVESHLAHHGKVAFIAIPARDPITSAVFYEAVFGWTLSPPDDERVKWTLGPWDNERVPFTDSAGALSGAFVAARGPSSDGMLLHIYVEDIEGALREIEARGCEILRPESSEGDVKVAEFRDPGGNTVGICQASLGE